MNLLFGTIDFDLASDVQALPCKGKKLGTQSRMAMHEIMVLMYIVSKDMSTPFELHRHYVCS